MQPPPWRDVPDGANAYSHLTVTIALDTWPSNSEPDRGAELGYVNAQAKIFALIVIKERQLGHDITDIYTQSIGVKAVVFFAKLDAQEGVLFSVQSFLQSI